jgi:hypothetical protein
MRSGSYPNYPPHGDDQAYTEWMDALIEDSEQEAQDIANAEAEALADLADKEHYDERETNP